MIPYSSATADADSITLCTLRPGRITSVFVPVPKRKKLLIVAGLVYLFMPLDIAPVVLGPVALVDDMVLWLWIIWNLKDTLDTYWVGEKVDDFSKDFSGKNLVEGVEFKVDEEE